MSTKVSPLTMDNKPVNHFLLVPLMTQSHLIPFTNMAKVLAHHGQQVTIVMTPLNAARWNSVIDYAMEIWKDYNNTIVSERLADGMLLNTFEDMETEYVKAYKKLVKNLWCIGPLSLINKSTPTVHEHECFNWLDSKKPGSVIYVCFGSLLNLSPPQLTELGLGLESSNYPFIWVLKKGDRTPELEEWLKEEKFEERVEGRGLIIREWAPQVEILSHQAIGGFLTHCGWNSTLEAVSAGVPMITWPMFADQSDNERLIVDVLKVGVKIGIEAAMKDVKELVKREDIKKAIEKLINGEETRKRAQELGQKAKRAFEKGGSSYMNVKSLIEHVTQRVSNLAKDVKV